MQLGYVVYQRCAEGMHRFESQLSDHLLQILIHDLDAYLTQTSRIVFGLLPHEHKKSVVNLCIKRTGTTTEPIRSKVRTLPLPVAAGWQTLI